jgi:hypothetical protein
MASFAKGAEVSFQHVSTKETEMLVYRIENAAGEGPYRGNGDCKRWLLSGAASSSRPPPFEDKRLREIRNYCGDRKISQLHALLAKDATACGFSSMKQLRIWFNFSDVRRLAREGFHIYCYEVPKQNVMQGSNQVLFDKSRSFRQSWVKF